MFTKLYLDTTNPYLTFTDIFTSQIFAPLIVSVVFHTVVYMTFCNMVSYIFRNALLTYNTNMVMLLCLVPIMFFGYIGRWFHVKDVFRAYNYNMDKTRAHLDKLYISWIFIA